MPAPAAWSIFARKAQALGASVEYASDEHAARHIVSGGTGLRCTASVSRAFPWLSEGWRAATENSNGAAAEVVAAALFAVAETGSLAVAESTADRGACFLAERLWLVVEAVDIVLTLDEALARIAALASDGAHYVTLMSGPSRTADIERTLTIGVHGPREVEIVIVSRQGLNESMGPG